MNDVPLAVYHDIAVVSVLDLKDVANNRVRCHGLDKVQASLLELDCVFPAIFRNKEV